MGEQFELFHKIIQKLGSAGILSDLVLIGSWCLYFYRTVFNDSDHIPLIRTMDMDLLVRNPHKITHKADVSLLLTELGFIEEFSPVQGFSKFIHPDLEVEFLIPEKGRGKDGPYLIKELNINAQGLRYISLLQDYTINVPYKEYKITVPEPAAFVLHKFHITRKRTSEPKRIKDIETAIELGEFIISFQEHLLKMRSILNSLPVKWKREIVSEIEKYSPVIYKALMEK